MLARVNRTYWPELVNEILKNDYKVADCNVQTNGNIPAVNIIEDEKGYEIDVAAPGLGRDDFKINLDNDLLTISSEKKEQKEEKESRYMRREFSYASFKRSFYLPDSVNADQISASHDNGILKINLPKREEELKKGPKTIEIA